MRTLDEFRKLPRATTRESAIAKVHLVAQQALRQDAVTGDPNWDYFLAYIEAAIAVNERARAGEDIKLRDPSLVNDEKIRVLRVNIVRIDERIATFKEVLSLPKFLKSQGEVARKQIAEFSAEQK